MRVLRVEDTAAWEKPDAVATEEPTEIRLVSPAGARSLAVTMRTPGHDFELAAGFLFGEGVVSRREEQHSNRVEVRLSRPVDRDRITRHVYTTSSCGVCGKAALEPVRVGCTARPRGDVRLDPEVLRRLPGRLRQAQEAFSRTGGLHACGLFTACGECLRVREDVGRHNAMDKPVGHLLLEGALPASDRLVLLSGRASFELLQKAVAAIGAPGNLAVELAREFSIPLVGLGRRRFNVYSGEWRISLPGHS